MISFHDVKPGMIFGTEARFLVTQVTDDNITGYNFVKAKGEKGGMIKSSFTEESWLKFMRMVFPEQNSNLRREAVAKIFTYEAN